MRRVAKKAEAVAAAAVGVGVAVAVAVAVKAIDYGRGDSKELM
jgi:hypothetical protein